MRVFDYDTLAKRAWKTSKERDLHGHDFIGEATVPLDELADQLAAKYGSHVSASVEVTVPLLIAPSAEPDLEAGGGAPAPSPATA